MPVRIVELIPLRPMPRRMGVFDYADPSAACAVGDLVEMPLRGKKAFGVVAKVKDAEPERPLADIARVAHAGYLRPSELAFFETLAEDLVQSSGSVLDAALPLPPKRAGKTPAPQETGGISLPADEVPAAREAIASLASGDNAFVQIPDLRRTAALIAGFLDASPDLALTVVTPNVRDAAWLHARLARFSPGLITGEDTNNARWRAWQDARERRTRLMVGTRLAALLPLPAPHAVWVVRAAHGNHRNADQNPRYDARGAALLMGRALGSRVIFSDVAPRPDDVAAFNVRLDPFPRPLTAFADPSAERRKAAHPLLGSSLLERVEEVLEAGKQALCVFNRVGDAAAVRCAECGFSFPCPDCRAVRAVEGETLRCRRCGKREPVPRSCSICGGYRIDRKGFGNRAVADALRAAFPGKTVAIVEKPEERGGVRRELVGDCRPNGGCPEPSIVLATQHWLENVFDPSAAPPVGLIALLDADAPLRSPDFRAAERAVLEAAEWRGAAHACRAAFLLQTEQPEFFQTALGDPTAWATDELARRTAYGLPPAARLARFTCRQHPPAEARKALEKIVAELGQAFPTAVITPYVKSDPGTFAAEVSVPRDAYPDLARFSRKIDDACLIDTSPFLW